MKCYLCDEGMKVEENFIVQTIVYEGKKEKLLLHEGCAEIAEAFKKDITNKDESLSSIFEWTRDQFCTNCSKNKKCRRTRVETVNCGRVKANCKVILENKP